MMMMVIWVMTVQPIRQYIYENINQRQSIQSMGVMILVVMMVLIIMVTRTIFLILDDRSGI